MRVLLFVAVVAGLLALKTGVLDAESVPIHQDMSVAMTGEGSTGDEPAVTESEDDDRVVVQLVVLGIVIATVFVIGTAAFGLRWKLGRTAYTPPPDVGHH